MYRVTILHFSRYSAGLLGPEMILIRLSDSNHTGEGDDGRPFSLREQLENLILLFKQLAADKVDIDRIYANMQTSVNNIIFGKHKMKKKEKKNKSTTSKHSDSNNTDGDSGDGMRRRKQLSSSDEYNLSHQEYLDESRNPLLPQNDPQNDPENPVSPELDEGVSLDQLTSESLALIVDGYSAPDCLSYSFSSFGVWSLQ